VVTPPDVRSVRDAIVVGAGLSGLVCARRLVEAGRDVVVLEARDRVGGRLHGGRLAGAVVDLGGQWRSPDQPRLAALAGELGVATYAHRRDGRVLLDEPAHGFAGALRSAFAQWRAMRRIARAPRTAALDTESLGDWLRRTVADPIARGRIALHAELVFAADPADLSLLHYLTTLDATGGFGRRGDEHGFAGGAHQLAHRLADRLGAALRLGDPVRAIEPTADAVTARTAAAATLTARRLVLALPPVAARAIELPLPPPTRRLVDAARAGAVVKCFAAYDQPFWRAAGWSGEAYHPRGTVRATVELAHDGLAALLAFVVGPPATAWRDRDPASRRAEVLATLAAQFGPAAQAPIDYLEHDWSADPWSAGCVACLPPGALAAGAAWHAPHPRIHLAGTEAARVWPGYLEGAIDAGEHAAREVLAAL
jgi:monoamine oxidase